MCRLWRCTRFGRNSIELKHLQKNEVMKNRIFYLAAALALLKGCLKDEGLDPDCGAATEGTTISLSMTDRTTVETRSAASATTIDRPMTTP